jgi:hypothetical protein
MPLAVIYTAALLSYWISGRRETHTMEPTASNQLEALNPLIENLMWLAGDLLYNRVLEEFETPFRVTGGHPPLFRHLELLIRDAMKSGAQILLNEEDEVDEKDLLVAFERVSRQMTDEVAVVGISKEGAQKPITSLSAVRGSPSSVTIPDVAMRQIRNRIQRKVSSRVIIIHNHPQGLLHALLESKSLGPSATDRNTASQWHLQWMATDGVITPEFYLVENKLFKRFIFPSAQTVVQIAKKLLNMK